MINYVGLFFEGNDLEKILSLEQNKLEFINDVIHCTFKYEPNENEIDNTILGEYFEVELIGYANNNSNSGFMVTLDDKIKKYYKNEVNGEIIPPHITCSIAKEKLPIETSNLVFNLLEKPIRVKGRYGYYIKDENGRCYVSYKPIKERKIMKKPILLTILDGCGLRDEKDGNAFENAFKPNFDKLMREFPHSKLNASGTYVGLPKGQMGNSEVGHMNIGAGRIVYQPLELINKSIEDKEFFQNEKILKVINHVKNNNSNLHIMGLLSDGGVHSHINHLKALIELSKMHEVNVYYHFFLDGRDVAPRSALEFIKEIEELNYGKVSTISGRYYSMDRDNNFDRLKKFYDALVYGEAPVFESAQEIIKKSYNKDISDEFVEPAIVNKMPLNDNDGVITFNFRKDRLRELFTCLTNPLYHKEEAKQMGMEIKSFNNLECLTMMSVVESVTCPFAFELPSLDNILGEYLEKNNKTQLRIAETEKYAHVTFFFDGGVEKDYKGMNKILIPSPKVATYDLKPEMSALEVTDKVIEELEKDEYDVIILNYANGDMVGHTGSYEASKKAIEFLDECIGRIYETIKKHEGIMMITADHGNCELMWDENHEIVTSHTTNLVPFIVTKKDIEVIDGNLCDIAPTILSMLNLEIPKEMTGKKLIK